MKKKLLILSLVLILNNCGFELAYQTTKNSFLINNNTIINVSGDETSQVRVALIDIFGNKNKDDFAKYKLMANSSKVESATSIKKDATASKFKIQYSIKYDLYNLIKSCKVFNKEIITISEYNAKSAGYSFGTDLSKQESNYKNINKNINEFLSFLDSGVDVNICIK